MLGGFTPDMLSQPAGAAQVMQGNPYLAGGYGGWGGNMFGVQNPGMMQQQQPGLMPGQPQIQQPSSMQGFAGGDIRQQFMPPNLTAPYYNMSGVAGNLGTMVGQNTPAAAQFMGGLFSPNLNPMEQAFMTAGMGNALTGLEQGMIRQEDQFEGTPFHSALPRAQGEVMEQFSRDMMSTGAQLGLQRQQLASQAAPFQFQFPLQAAQAPVAAAEGMFNLGQQAYNSYTQFPMQFYQQYPVPTPTVLAQQSGGGKA